MVRWADLRQLALAEGSTVSSRHSTSNVCGCDVDLHAFAWSDHETSTPVASSSPDADLESHATTHSSDAPSSPGTSDVTAHSSSCALGGSV